MSIFNEKQTDIGDVIQSCKEKGETKAVAYLTVIEQTDRGTAEKVYRALKKVFDNTPTIEPKKGEWLDHYYPYCAVAGIECSVCGKDVEYWERHYDFPNFCPNCGTDMRGADNDNR